MEKVVLSGREHDPSSRQGNYGQSDCNCQRDLALGQWNCVLGTRCMQEQKLAENIWCFAHSLSTEFIHLLCCLASEFQGFVCLHSPVLGSQLHAAAWVYMHVGRIQTQIPMLVWQALSHTSRHLHPLLCVPLCSCQWLPFDHFPQAPAAVMSLQ